MTTPYPPELAAILGRLDDPARPQEAAGDQAVRLIAADWLDERATTGERCVCWLAAGTEIVWAGCYLCGGTGRRGDNGYTDYAAFLRLMAREGVCPMYHQDPDATRTPWRWSEPGPGYDPCATLPEEIFNGFPRLFDDGQPYESTEGRGAKLAFFQTRNRAERALYAAWVASGRPATLRG